jgi:hypothetical protein
MWGFESSIPSQTSAHSSSGPGHLPLKEEIGGSNPPCAIQTAELGPVWGPFFYPGETRGPTRCQSLPPREPALPPFLDGATNLAHGTERDLARAAGDSRQSNWVDDSQ